MIFTRVVGLTIYNVAMAFCDNKMEPYTEVAGGMDFSMERVMKSKLMGLNTLVNIIEAKKRVVEFINGMTDKSTSVSGKMMSFMGLEYFSGKMEEFMLDNGTKDK